MAFDSNRQVCVLFGGAAQSGQYLLDTWEWDGADWTQRSTAIQPVGRAEHGMVYDSKRGKIVLFGGDNAESFSLTDTWEYPLTPPRPPVQIVTQPVSVTACVGETVSLQVVATGDPPLTYQWRRNGVNFGLRNARLDLSPVRATSAGVYDVVVSNRCNTVVSATATLTLCDGSNPEPEK